MHHEFEQNIESNGASFTGSYFENATSEIEREFPASDGSRETRVDAVIGRIELAPDEINDVQAFSSDQALSPQSENLYGTTSNTESTTNQLAIEDSATPQPLPLRGNKSRGVLSQLNAKIAKWHAQSLEASEERAVAKWERDMDKRIKADAADARKLQQRRRWMQHPEEALVHAINTLTTPQQQQILAFASNLGSTESGGSNNEGLIPPGSDIVPIPPTKGMTRRTALKVGAVGIAAILAGVTFWASRNQSPRSSAASSGETPEASSTSAATEQPTQTETPQPTPYETAWQNGDGNALDLTFRNGIKLTKNSTEPCPYGAVGAVINDENGSLVFAQTTEQINDDTMTEPSNLEAYINTLSLAVNEETQPDGRVAVVLKIGGVANRNNQQQASDALKYQRYTRRIFAGWKGDRSPHAAILVTFQDTVNREPGSQSFQAIYPDDLLPDSKSLLAPKVGSSFVIYIDNVGEGMTEFLSALREGRVPDSDENLPISELQRPQLRAIFRAV